MVSVAVGIPWRPAPSRLRAFHHITSWYATNLPDATLILADSGHDSFHRAASRNEAVRRAFGHDVIVLNDADTLPPLDGLLEAIDAAHTRGGIHFGFNRFVYLDETQTADLYAGRELAVDGVLHNSSVLVVRPADWWAAGGQDMRFAGWGGEDDAFFAASRMLLGTPGWHEGLAVSLWHDSERDVGSDRWAPNSALANRYIAARTPHMTRQLIEEGTDG